MVPRLKEQYVKEIRPQMLKEGNFKNIMDVPRLVKIVVNSGVGEATSNSSAIEEVAQNIALITGQKPVVTKARKAVSAFKIRQGFENGVAVTLRGAMMWEFLDKLINIVFPRTTDFRGLSAKAFDGRGNYSIGIREHSVFPEIDPNKVQKIRGLQITIVTTAKDNKSAKMLLDKFGFPFVKNVN